LFADALEGLGKYEKEINAKVRTSIGPVASLRATVFVPKLPKTRSGKIPRNTLTKMANGEEYQVW
jgi:propionyl-CoA synthetase